MNRRDDPNVRPMQSPTGSHCRSCLNGGSSGTVITCCLTRSLIYRSHAGIVRKYVKHDFFVFFCMSISRQRDFVLGLMWQKDRHDRCKSQSGKLHTPDMTQSSRTMCPMMLFSLLRPCVGALQQIRKSLTFLLSTPQPPPPPIHRRRRIFVLRFGKHGPSGVFFHGDRQFRKAYHVSGMSCSLYIVGHY